VSKRKQHGVLFSRRDTPQSKEHGKPSRRGAAGDYATGAGDEKSHPRNQKRKQSIGLLFRFWNDVFR